jgi:glycosyltransferase involved in cell wall biosynthesis
MSRLTVVHAAKFYPPVRGGMETVIGDLCDGTAGEWDVRVVAANDRPRTVHERVGAVDVVRVAAFGAASSVPLCPSYAIHLWRHTADCVVLHEPNPIAGGALFLRVPSRRLIVWHHSDLLRPWWAPHTYGRVQQALYRRAACVNVTSPNLATQADLVRHARRVAVVPFGIPVERYRQGGALAERLRTSIAGPRVLFVGRFVYYKGLDVLIDAMAQAPGTLLLVGEGPLEPELRSRVALRGLQSRVLFLGRVSDSDLPEYYQAADVFVLPSVAKTEAFGVVQVEAMAAGVPVISTNLPTGVPWVNQDGVSGLVVPPGDATALAAAINRLVSDEDLRLRLGRNAAARASEVFSRDRMIRAFKEVVEQAIDAPEAIAAARAEAS